jgi:succinate dehydrogenase/fumarate reductase flavoprotein subunit
MAECFAAIRAKEHGLDVTLTDKGYVGKTGAAHFSEGEFVFFGPK